MTRRRFIGVAAWILWAVDLAVYIAAILLFTRATGPQLDLLTLVGAFQVFPLVGAIIASLRPHNRIGWLFLAIGLGTATTSFSGAYLAYAGVIHAEGALATQIIGILGNIVWPLNLGFGCILLFLFPDGHLPSRRWRYIFWLDIAAIIASSLASAFMPGPVNTDGPPVMNPIGVPDAADPLNAIYGVGSAVFALLSLAAVASLIVRYIRTQDEQRQRIKWFVFGTALMVVILVLTFTTVDENDPLSNVGFALGIVMLPIGAGVGVLKYRLYDVDVIINRALVYALLTAILVVIYAVGVIGVQTAVGGFTGNAEQQQPLLIVATTLLVAALFQPLRRRLQAFIDHRFYRTKYDVARTLSTFGATLRDEVELNALTEHLIGTVDDTMRPVDVSLWLRSPMQR
ncbi:MAG TPA: hypothetical protein VGP82_18635 [Ktedonobacterales bacterium]|jgi:hypothetical protein|nr:hypothetical protein [Ktedonobacterales bacterium]